MNQLIHVHELLHIIAEANPPHSRKSLQQEMENQYGQNIRFASCQNHQMNLEETIQFAKDREKIEEKEGYLYIKSNVHICEDD